MPCWVVHCEFTQGGAKRNNCLPWASLTLTEHRLSRAFNSGPVPALASLWNPNLEKSVHSVDLSGG